MHENDIRKIACIGEVMIELVAGRGNEAHLNVAGDTYNTAVYMARELGGTGVEIDYVTVLGTDGFSRRILRHMKANGVGTDAATQHPTRMPGLYAIETDENGERSFTYWRSQSAARTLFEDTDPLATLKRYDLVYLSGISIAILPQNVRDRLAGDVEEFRKGGGLLAFDSNYRPHLWNDPGLARLETERFWRLADIALPSVDDEMNIFGDADETGVLRRMAGYGLRRGALKRAAAGPIDLGPGHTAPDVAAVEDVVDTTAAGDSFNAAYLAALVQGKSSLEAMVAGHDLASKVIGQRGAIVDV